jgi:CHAT domain-containing protein
MGIALAGANDWFRGQQVEDLAQVGIMLAHEIAALDLHGTEMVVLSGCETGVGDSPSMHAEIGLRSQFMIAGARSVCATLWRVLDSGALCLMANFYSLLAAGLDRSEALRLAKLEARKAGHDWRIFAGFVLYGSDGPLAESAHREEVKL